MRSLERLLLLISHLILSISATDPLFSLSCLLMDFAPRVTEYLCDFECHGKGQMSGGYCAKQFERPRCFCNFYTPVNEANMLFVPEKMMYPFEENQVDSRQDLSFLPWSQLNEQPVAKDPPKIPKIEFIREEKPKSMDLNDDSKTDTYLVKHDDLPMHPNLKIDVKNLEETKQMRRRRLRGYRL